jgi:hypothetical protein
MGQAFPLPVSDAVCHLFLVGQCKGGFWVARDLEGTAEGVFREKKEALRFAMREGGHDNAVMLSPSLVEPNFGRGVR